MESIKTILLITGVLGSIVGLFTSYASFDKLIKIEYYQYNQEWIKDGKPRGFYWRPPESTMFLSAMAMQMASFIWLFKTPEWASRSSEAMDSLRNYRLRLLALYVGMFALLVISLSL